MTPAVPEASLTALMHLLTEQALLSMGVPHPMVKEAPPRTQRWRDSMWIFSAS